MIRYFIRIILELVWSDWVYVGSFTIGQIEWKAFGSYSTLRAGTIANCYESRWGTRHTTITIVDDEWPRWILKHRVRSMSEYQCEVRPWLRGRPHKQIPSFRQVIGRKWDFKKLLKGETPYILNDDEKA